MAFNVKRGGTDFELVPQGIHAAVCYALIDLGTQKGSYQGKETYRHQVQLRWELPDVKLTEGDRAGQPAIVTKNLTASLDEKATLTKLLVSWRGQAFTKPELETFDLERVVGRAAQLQVIHEPAKDGSGKIFATLSNVLPAPRGYVVPELFNKKCIFTLSNFDPAVFDTLSDKMKEKIQLSPEYAEATGTGGGGDADESGIKTPSGTVDKLDEDIPF